MNEGGAQEVSRRYYQPDHIGVPFGNGDQEKFNWCSVAPT